MTAICVQSIIFVTIGKDSNPDERTHLIVECWSFSLLKIIEAWNRFLITKWKRGELPFIKFFSIVVQLDQNSCSLCWSFGLHRCLISQISFHTRIFFSLESIWTRHCLFTSLLIWMMNKDLKDVLVHVGNEWNPSMNSSSFHWAFRFLVTQTNEEILHEMTRWFLRSFDDWWRRLFNDQINLLLWLVDGEGDERNYTDPASNDINDLLPGLVSDASLHNQTVYEAYSGDVWMISNREKTLVKYPGVMMANFIVLIMDGMILTILLYRSSIIIADSKLLRIGEDVARLSVNGESIRQAPNHTSGWWSWQEKYIFTAVKCILSDDKC